MKFDILTLFPKMFSSPFQESILGKAIEKGLIQIQTINIRDFTLDKHQVVDDTPYGGGQGMVMKVEPIARAIEWVKSQNPSAWTIYLTPQGKPFNQTMAKELSSRSHLVLLCGRYEGIDERVRNFLRMKRFRLAIMFNRRGIGSDGPDGCSFEASARSFRIGPLG
jgi:tRNA (guanine37-N1)-methyltransferase